MAELEIDQSHLPRVQEVEQYYTTNIQKNQLVQNDIQIAKRLQDEEEEQQAQQSALLRQTSRQIEEQDLEYARVIQEEIQRNAEEAQRREQDDEEMAKRIQEEEEQRVRRRSRGYERHHHQGNISNSAQLSPLQHTLNRLHRGQEQFSSATSRWQCSTSHSQLTGPQSDSLREEAAQENTTSWSSQGQTDYIRQIRNELRESSSENSDDSDTVFPVQRSVWPCRLNKRVNAAPSRQWTSLHQQPERHRSFPPHSALTDEYRCFEEREQWDGEDYDDLHKRPRNPDKGRMHRDDYEGWHRSRDQDADSRLYMRKRQPSHSESVRLHDRNKQSNRGLARTWSYRDDPDKHVHFEEDTRSSYQHQNENSQVWAMLGHILRDRGVPVSFGDNGAPLQITPQRRDSQVLHGSEVSCSDSQPHQRVFQRATTTRHSFHGDIRERRRLSYRENSGRDHREERDRHHDNGEVDEISSRVPDLTNRERRGSRWWKEQRCTTKDDIGERNANS
ncbi:coiled-coil domain-containing protein 187 isoform 2-T2 [Pholidichthys leucotaenia]